MTSTTFCDHPGCEVEIELTLETACGLQRTGDGYSCDHFFCAEHRANVIEVADRYVIGICDDCFAGVTVDAQGRVEGHKHFGIEGRT